MAAVVYEGVVGGGGNLFAGMKFFILQRVPMRDTYLEAITLNGGEVVKLEKKADIIIADHARKDCPTGSTSWTFIEKSVREGKLEDLENHRAGPTTHLAREVASTQPTKLGRTRFTAQDDHILTLWVTKAERNGIPIRGNEIYKQLEAINPRHTFQSWRDRWVKQLADKPRPEISEEDLSTLDGNTIRSNHSNHLSPARSRRSPRPGVEVLETDPPHPSRQEPTSPPLSAVSRPANARPKPTESASTPEPTEIKPKDKPTPEKTPSILPLIRKSTGGMIFNNGEIDYMIENYEVMASADQTRGVNAWAKFSVEHPNHSAQEWHDYFIRTIKPLVEKRLQNSKKHAPGSDYDQASANSKNNSTPKQARIHSSVNMVDDEQNPQVIESPRLPQKVSDPSTEDEALFIEDLTATAEDNGLEVEFNPVICGRPIPLFRLWQVVNSTEFGGYDEVNERGLWLLIAKKLNFHEFRHPTAPQEIKSNYEYILPDFEAARADYVAELQEQAMIEEQLRETADRARNSTEEPVDEILGGVGDEEDEEDYNDDLEAPASVLRQQHSWSSNKRAHDVDQGAIKDGSTPVGTYNKRQRIDKGKGKEREIPSTPEDVIRANLAPRPSHQLSPIKYPEDAGEENRDHDGLSTRQVKKLNLLTKRQKLRNLEPETQDFNFAPAEDDAMSLSPLPNHRKKKTGIPYVRSVNEDSPTQSQTTSQKDSELKEFVDHHIALGYSQEIVIEALQSTNMNTGDAPTVMEALTSGNGIPDNIQGVWTAMDDAALEDIESEGFDEVVRKHGAKSVAVRQKFWHESTRARSELGKE